MDSLAELIDNALESMEINGMHDDHAYRALKAVMIYDGAKTPRLATPPAAPDEAMVRERIVRAMEEEKATWMGDFREAAYVALNGMLDRYDAALTGEKA